MDIIAIRRVSAVRRMLASGQAREQRKALHLSVREVARAVGMNPGTVSRWETGACKPRADSALKLAEVLDIETQDAA
ncbi:helix-turn-helix domain-containing protein [Kitasatospora sp. NPDC056327]|uniref:helix-turn-helix domain-containing protein n=1 Tax=Kitasatospora sp. NPDC056327 TaxID=3345785 RepID=UPI0035E0FCB0